MGFLDKVRAYLNEDDEPSAMEDVKMNPGSERKPDNQRVHLQDESDAYEIKDRVTKNKSGREIRYVDETAASPKASNEPKTPKKKYEGYDESLFIGSEKEDIEGYNAPALSEKEEKREQKRLLKLQKKLDKKERKLNRKKDDSDEKEQRTSKQKQSFRQEAKGTKRLTKEQMQLQTVKDFCEQLIDATTHMEEMTTEYRLVTDYLTDIQKIEELPVGYAQSIMDTAARIEALDNSRQMYLQSENLLPSDQYMILEKHEKEVPDSIKKLIDIEMRDSLLRSDMGHLEGEKEDLKYMREEYKDGISRVRGMLTTIIVISLLTLLVVTLIAFNTKETVTVYVLAIIAFVALSFAIGYAKYLDLNDSIKYADAKIKRAISLLNKVKVKFINNTNTRDYIYDKFRVNSSNELEYRWERYNVMKRDLLKYSQTNTELRACCDSLVQKLKGYGIKDPDIWLKQTHALLDRREMVEIKHSLNTGRQRLRESILTCDQIRENATTALKASVVLNPGMTEIIKEMLGPHGISILN